jgi:hypothetical protein
LAKTKFIPDPVAGLKYSRSTSIISSAYKRPHPRNGFARKPTRKQ